MTEVKSMRKLRLIRAFAFLQQLLLLSGLLTLCLLMDAAFAISLDWRYFIIVFPMTISCSLGTFLMGMRRQCLILFGLFAAIFLALPHIDLNASKPLARFCLDVRPGMTLTDMDRLLSKHFPAGGRYTKPEMPSELSTWVWIYLTEEDYNTCTSNNVGCDMAGPEGTAKGCYLFD
jgi:hypothetical protein